MILDKTRTNILVSIDDEPMKLNNVEWGTFTSNIFGIIDAHSTMAMSTEPVYFFAADGYNRVAMVKGRVLKKHLKDIADLVQEEMRNAAVRTGGFVPSVSLHHTDFCESLIVRKEGTKKWIDEVSGK